MNNTSKTAFARIVSGSAFLFFCRISGAAATFLTQLLLARWLGAGEFGSYILAFSWMTLLSAIPIGGYNHAAVRFIGRGLAGDKSGYAHAFIKHAVRTNMLWSMAIAISGIALVFALPGLFSNEKLLFVFMMSGVPFFAVLRINTGIALAMSNFAIGYLPSNVFRPLLFLLLVSIAWSQGASLNAELSMKLQVLALILLAAVTSLLMLLSTRGIRSSSPKGFDDEKSVWNRAAIPLLGVTLFTNYFQQITVIISGFFLPTADIGIYNVGYRIAMLISFTLVAIDAFVAPSLSRYYHQDDRVEFLREIQYSTMLRFGISLLAVIFLIVFGNRVLALFGEEFVSGYALMIFLSLAQLAHAAVGPVTRLLAISGHQNFSMYASGGSLVLWLALTSVLLPIYGVNGVAASVFIALTGWALILRYLVRKNLGISIFIFVRDLKPQTVPPHADNLAD